LAAIWTDLLAVERVGIHDNFFQLGGDSLLAMRLVSSIRRELNIEISILAIFESQTINKLSEYLDILLFRNKYSIENNLEGFEL
ncbi:phosphopantetheine-binding protein, partial [Mucilaginibacter sp. RCC_168]|uniref:phosphopantetheine-binding protein n=1 Tax=Mucilaginibacter sp. RCC_168 TaxID=3239221 RepID=UPI0035244C46